MSHAAGLVGLPAPRRPLGTEARDRPRGRPHGVPPGPGVIGPIAGLPRDLVVVMRPRAKELVDGTVTQIQDQVDAYAGPRRGRRRRLIENAVGGAVHYFLDALEGRHGAIGHVDELFWRMGRAEAVDGNSLEAMHAALDIATRDAWRVLHVLCVETGVSVALLGQLGEALFALIDHLIDQVSLGYRAARQELDRARDRARVELTQALLSGTTETEVEPLAATAYWPLPDRAIIIVAESRNAGARLDPVLANAQLLVRVTAPFTVIVVPLFDRHGPHDETLGELLEEIREVLDAGRIAVGWPVAPTELPDALRWGRRTLELARLGVLPDREVLRCAEHRTELWLHSEPLLRRQVCHDVLEPLLRETPHSRDVLSRTLLAWLSFHDSAPALARRLGVHAQTVRYRLRRLHQLFGEALDDPEQVLAMKFALEASLPLWAAGQVAADVEDLDWS